MTLISSTIYMKTPMRRLMTFLMGMIAGGLFVWVAMQYHLLRTNEGFRLIPKIAAGLPNTYVDIRSYTVADWARNTDLALALSNSNHEGLMGNAAEDAVRNGLDRWIERGN